MATVRMLATLRWPRITELLLALVLLVTLVAASAAQEPLRAVLKAQPVEGWVLEPAPSSLRFTTDSELNARLRPLAELLLAQRGYAIGGAALLRIEIETDLQTRRPRRRVGLSADAGDSSFGQVGVQIKSPFKKADRRAPSTSYRVYVKVRGTNNYRCGVARSKPKRRERIVFAWPAACSAYCSNASARRSTARLFLSTNAITRAPRISDSQAA